MRIALVVGMFDMGGIESFLLRLGERLLSHGHEVSLIATDSVGAWWPKASEAGFDTRTVFPTLTESKARWSRRVAAEIRSTSPDVVILNHSWPAQVSASMLDDATAVFSVMHGEPPFVTKVSCANREAVNFIVAPSPRLFDVAVAKGILKENILLIPHGVEVTPFLPHSFAPGALKALYLGRIEERQKGVLLLPEILRLARAKGLNVTLDVVGSGPDEERLRDSVVRAGLSDVVRFEGPLPNPLVHERLCAADLVLMPSRWEGLPILVLESMATGCLVAVSRLPGITDWALDEGRCGYLGKADDAESFARALEEVAMNPGEAEAKRRRAWERCRTLFSVESMVDSYLHAFEAAKARLVHRRGLSELSGDLVSWKDYLPRWICRPMEDVRRSMESFWPTN